MAGLYCGAELHLHSALAALGAVRDALSHPAAAVSTLATHPDPLAVNVAIMLTAALLSWIFFLATDNCSHVDRLWSILPAVYVWIYAREDVAALVRPGRGDPDPRMLWAVAITSIWAVRLTYNFARKGGYRLSFEDYRWPVVRAALHPVLFHLLNLFFVAFAQHVLCLAITLPVYVAHLQRGRTPLGPVDAIGAALSVLLLIGEAAADQQQWRFQTKKHALIATKAPLHGDYARGFLTQGFWKFSRHPNWFCEYMFWWSVYITCALGSLRCLVAWPAVGAVGVTLLLHTGSLMITEHITSRKYPAYRAYQAATSAVLPWLPGPPLPGVSSSKKAE